ncbi:hypothetical protein [Rhizobium etli]|uniref:hypothetical protein n=1 Tax=Rhizobium etli TaxID=29449 RepID=UPI001FDA8304|nr:hypothetical protein [Rhizobium etli]
MARQADPERQPIILHVDDHRDLGSPRLRVEANGWSDMISGNTVTLSDPVSVTNAIASGAIGMGSFMTPFLHHFPRCEVRHLCQPPKARSTKIFRIEPGLVSDSLLNPSASRPSVTLGALEPHTGPSTYLLTPNIEDWLAGTRNRRFLLHIDLDYFNNRYDGDSDWLRRESPLDPPRDVIMARIDELVSALSPSDIAARIDDVVIAFSPGFFPAEFWQEADRRLVDGLGLSDG